MQIINKKNLHRYDGLMNNLGLMQASNRFQLFSRQRNLIGKF